MSEMNGEEAVSEEISKEKLNKFVNQNLANLEGAMSLLPPSQARNNAEHYLQNAVLWFTQAFNAADDEVINAAYKRNQRRAEKGKE